MRRGRTGANCCERLSRVDKLKSGNGVRACRLRQSGEYPERARVLEQGKDWRIYLPLTHVEQVGARPLSARPRQAASPGARVGKLNNRRLGAGASSRRD